MTTRSSDASWSRCSIRLAPTVMNTTPTSGKGSSMRLLVQTKLSNINYKHNQFDLACDSGWQMVMGRVREMLRLNPDLQIDVMGPKIDQLVDKPSIVNHSLDWNYLYAYVDPTVEGRGRLNYIQHQIVPNALATRYDLNFDLL